MIGLDANQTKLLLEVNLQAAKVRRFFIDVTPSILNYKSFQESWRVKTSQI